MVTGHLVRLWCKGERVVGVLVKELLETRVTPFSQGS